MNMILIKTQINICKLEYDVVAQISNPGACEAEAGGSWIQTQPWLYRELTSSLDHLRPCLKTHTQKKAELQSN